MTLYMGAFQAILWHHFHLNLAEFSETLPRQAFQKQGILEKQVLRVIQEVLKISLLHYLVVLHSFLKVRCS